MKLLLAFSVSLWSLAAFGSIHSLSTQYYTGNGVAIHPDGSAERYLITLSVSKQSTNKYALSYDLQFGDKNDFFDLFYVHDKVDSSFFSIFMRGGEGYTLVGHGYCWGVKCHVNWNHNRMNVEHTYQRNRRTGAIHGMGSRTNARGVMYLWKEVLQPLR